MDKTTERIISQFDLKGMCTDISPITHGNINRTYKFEMTDAGRKSYYLLQKINTFVFKKPDELMQNILGITEFLKKKIRLAGGDEKRETVTVIPTHDGKSFFTDENGESWRCYIFIDGTYSCNTIDSEEVFFQAGKAFGKFQQLLSDYPSETLFETIPFFHDTYKRYLALEKAIEENKAGRREEVRSEIEFIRRREADTKKLTSLIETGELPIRVTHNDTKLNNILFDEKTDEGICIIDLDTVMPGLSLYDFGDSIRSGACPAEEDERVLDRVFLDLGLFKAYAKGYLLSAGESLTEKEKDTLAFSSKVMTLELAIRFLTDYLNGDEYFKINYPDHNLVRTRAQLKLVADIENKLPEMESIIKELCK